MELEPGYTIDDLIADGLSKGARVAYRRGADKQPLRKIAESYKALLREVYLALARRSNGTCNAVIVASNRALAAFSHASEPMRRDQIAQAVINWKSWIGDGLTADVRRGGVLYSITFHFIGSRTHYFWITVERATNDSRETIVDVRRWETAPKIALVESARPSWIEVAVLILLVFTAGAAAGYTFYPPFRRWVNEKILRRPPEPPVRRSQGDSSQPASGSLSVTGATIAPPPITERFVVSPDLEGVLVALAKTYRCDTSGRPVPNSVSFSNIPTTSLPLVVLRNGRRVADVVELLYIKEGRGAYFYLEPREDLRLNQLNTYRLGRRRPNTEVYEVTPGATIIALPHCPPVQEPGHLAGTFSAYPVEGEAPLKVNFAVDIKNPDRRPLTYTWSFSDDLPSQPARVTREPAITHTFPWQGRHRAWVVVRDDVGNELPLFLYSGNEEVQFNVKGGILRPPYAGFASDGMEQGAMASREYATIGEEVVFGITPPHHPGNAKPIWYRWTFGDCSDRGVTDCFVNGSPSPTTRHTFQTSGMKRVDAEVTYDNGDVAVVNAVQWFAVMTDSGDVRGCCSNFHTMLENRRLIERTTDALN